jgi:hypothetical protein
LSPIGNSRSPYNYNNDEQLPQNRTPVAYGRPPLTTQDKVIQRRENNEIPPHYGSGQLRREVLPRP